MRIYFYLANTGKEAKRNYLTERALRRVVLRI